MRRNPRGKDHLVHPAQKLGRIRVTDDDLYPGRFEGRIGGAPVHDEDLVAEPVQGQSACRPGDAGADHQIFHRLMILRKSL
jgi:hypothetical protein